MPAKSPTVLRRQVAAELRRLREGSRRPFAQVARELGWNESKLSRIETAKSGIRKADLDRLLDLYGVEEPDRSRLDALAAQARQRGWWEAYGDALPDAYTSYIGFEAEASAILSYQPLVVFGLLQTAEYARAVISASALSYPPEIVAQRVAARLARQEVLTREPPPRLHVILDEAALRRPIGGPDVKRRQILRLIEVGERAQSIIQVLPLSVGAHGGLAGSFVLLDFSEDSEPPLAYSEGLGGGLIRTGSEETRNYRVAFKRLEAASLGEGKSRDFLVALSNEG